MDAVDLEWDKKTQWFIDDKILKRLNGLISEDIPVSDKHPHVVIEGRFSVPFTNDSIFKKYQDENAEVSFFIGFSPMGLRAWRVTRGFAAGGSRKELATAFRSRTVESDTRAADQEWILRQVKELNKKKVQDMAYELVNAHSQWGSKLNVAQLQSIIEGSLGIENIHNLFGMDSFKELLQTVGSFKFEFHNDYCSLSATENYGHDEIQEGCEKKHLNKSNIRMLTRVVIYLNKNKDYGFIENKEKKNQYDRDYWFKISETLEVASGYVNLGDFVCFIPSRNATGLIATKIQLAEQAQHSDCGNHAEEQRKLGKIVYINCQEKYGYIQDKDRINRNEADYKFFFDDTSGATNFK